MTPTRSPLLETARAQYARTLDARLRKSWRISRGEYEVDPRRALRRHHWQPTCARSCVLSVQVIVEQDGRREQGSAGGGGRFDYSLFHR